MKGLLSLMVITCYLGVCYPQSPQAVKGIVFNARSGLRVGGVSIKNNQQKSYSHTNDRGEFNITGTIGDTLFLNANGYTPAHIVVSDFKDKAIQLQPSNTLAEVVVKADPLNKSLQEIQEGYVSKGIFYKGRPPLALLSPFGGSPLTFLYEMTSKDAKHARRFNDYLTTTEENAEINKRFNDSLIRKLVPVQAGEINEFKQRYKPTLSQIREWNDVELYEYIRKSYIEFIGKE